MKLIAENRCFEGRQLRYEHSSKSLNCSMNFSVFLPPQSEGTKVPLIYWLSGLTCTDLNFVQKAGAQRCAAELGFAIVAPDTSPRGDNVPGDPEGHWSFGLGAGYYLDATQAPWAEHYQMYSYIRQELPELVENTLPVSGKRAIMGHSMGGHGALCIGLKNPDFYQSISAFAPICNPVKAPWGQTAFGRFLGEDQSAWAEYDATELLKKSDSPLPIKIDQGGDDEFLQEQLMPQHLLDAASAKGVNVDYALHAGYDHSYFFIASFIDEHIKFHSQNV